ncbi:MAG: type I DNA topoisomerase [Chloroflexi bacterium]|nr:type I DNA topoisomerase [Chloroflexota bacterium]
MKGNLVIVESPAKAKTLSKILGRNYSLKASLGHVRDLPKSQLGVDVAHDFLPKYVVPKTKSKIVKELREAVKAASTVYLATDPDREGEAISWHLREVTRDGASYKRVFFHEITDEAVKQAFKHPRSIDMQLVNAQQARRVLDRLVGYKISPLLWRKVRGGLSAGRVQSVALRIIVDRERQIQQFKPEEYWTIDAELDKAGTRKASPFRATLVGHLDGKKLDIHHEDEVTSLVQELKKAGYTVLKIKTKQVARQPAPPFITSTLQQEAWRKLHFTAKQTMAVAQQLYEGLPIGKEGSVGLITYMRTDSTKVAHSAVAEARDFIEKKYGAKFLPPHARAYTRVVKGAQEAHEAIRPTRIGREPSYVKPYLTPSQFRLYQLIWQRMLASQMAAAMFDNTAVDIKAKCARTSYLFRVTNSVNTFQGFMVLYSESKDEVGEEGENSFALPKLEAGDELKLRDLFPEQHFTKPPPRFTEATLVKALEQQGIGRPSTYAPILSTIQERGYVKKDKGSFLPTELGFLINDLLVNHFPDVVDIAFTARMEEELDEIAQDNKDWVSVVADFYKPLEKDLEKAATTIEKVKFEEKTDELCPNCGKPLVIKMGRFGKFIACSGYPECRFTKPLQIKVGVKCPECGGELLQRVSKKKRTFYGCSNYPKCTFTMNQRPLPQPCPKCGGLLVTYRQNGTRCTKCEYRGKIESAKEEPVLAAKH